MFSCGTEGLASEGCEWPCCSPLLTGTSQWLKKAWAEIRTCLSAAKQGCRAELAAPGTWAGWEQQQQHKNGPRWRSSWSGMFGTKRSRGLGSSYLFVCPGCCEEPGCSARPTGTASSYEMAPCLSQSVYSMALAGPGSHSQTLETVPTHNVQISAVQYCAWSTALSPDVQFRPCLSPRLQRCSQHFLTGWEMGPCHLHPGFVVMDFGKIWSLCCMDLLEKSCLCFLLPALPWSRRTALAVAGGESLVQIFLWRPGVSWGSPGMSWKSLDLNPLVRTGVYH